MASPEGTKYRVLGIRLVVGRFSGLCEECLDWAKTAKSDNERDVFLQMVQAWLEAAMRSEAGPTKVQRARHEVITRLSL
jgi:hypothetical protein